MKLVEPPPSCSAASAVVFIGRNSRGDWVAQEQNGLFGGLFVSRKDAVKYALFENGRHPETIVEVREIELDMGGYPADSAKAEVAAAIAAIGDEDLACPIESWRGSPLRSDVVAARQRCLE